MQLTATTNTGYAFMALTGDVSATSSPQSVTMNAPKNVTANFRSATTNQPPTGWDIAPFEGAGLSQVFAAQYSDPNGPGDISKTYLTIHEAGAAVASSACRVEHNVLTSQVRLLDDAGTSWLGPVAMGGSGTLQNSSCTLDAASSSTGAVSGNLVVSYALSFKAAFTAGRPQKKAVCLAANDWAGAGGQYLCLGDWIPAAVAPALVSRYRLYNSANNEHLFTTDQNEYNVLGSFGWQQEGVQGQVYSQPTTANGVPTKAYLRLVMLANNLHFWTSDRNEYLFWVVKNPFFAGEAIDCWLIGQPGGSALPLYRLVFVPPSPLPIHHWTTDQNEYNVLTGTGAWKSEGIDGYMMPSGSGQGGVVPPAVGAPQIVTVVNAASRDEGPVAPGSLIRLYGHGFSRQARVFVDGVVTPVTAVADRYLELVAPDSAGGRSELTFEIDDLSGRSEAVSVALVRSRPAIFIAGDHGKGFAEVLESEPGTVTVVATGLGDGPLQAILGGHPAEVLSAEPIVGAPGRVAVKLRLPAEVAAEEWPAARLTLKTGEFMTQQGVLARTR